MKTRIRTKCLKNKMNKTATGLNHMNVPCEFCGDILGKNVINTHKRLHLMGTAAYSCEFCQKPFTTLTKLVLHQHTDHEVDMQCKQCAKTFHNANSFTRHLKSHNRKKLFACDICDFVTTKKVSLDSHKLKEHEIGEFPFRCEICAKGFFKSNLLKVHMNAHRGLRPHQCDKCGASYASGSSLEMHCHNKHPELSKQKLLRCPQCRRLFKNLEAHKVAKHNQADEGFACDFCGKKFSFPESLKRHRRIHTGEKPNHCSYCDKRFSCASYLQCHVRTHTGERPYQCKICWKSFSQRTSLVVHKKIHLKEPNTN